MLTPQDTLLIDLNNIFSEKTLNWLIPALRQDELIWHSLQDMDFRAEVIENVGDKAQTWMPARLGLVALNRELPSRHNWPPNSISPTLRQRAIQSYQNFIQTPSSGMSLAKAFLLALALLENYRGTPSWKDVLIPCQPLDVWKTPLACLFGLTETRSELLNALSVSLGVQVLLATPLPLIKAKEDLLTLLGVLPLDKQLTWLKTIAPTRPELTSKVANALASNENIQSYLIPELIQHAELYQLAQCPEKALHFLQQASQKHQVTKTQLAARLNTTTAQLQQIPLTSLAWKEVIIAIRTPQGINEHASEIVSLLETLVEKGYLAAAENLVENIATPYPDNPSLLTALASLAIVQENDEQAAKLARQAVESLSENSPAPPALSEILLKVNLPQASITAAHHTLATYPSQGHTLTTLAKAQNSLGEYSEAAENARLTVLLSPQQIDLRRDLAGYLEKAQEWEAALEEREHILKTFEKTSNAKSTEEPQIPVEDQRSLARCALNADQPDRAAQVCQNILHNAPQDGLAHAILGKSLSALGNPQEAAEHLTQATEIAPHLPEAWLSMAELHQKTGKTEQAIRTLNIGVNSATQGAEIYLALGKIHQERAEHTQALTAFQKASKLAKKEITTPAVNFQTQLNLGKSLKHLGRLEEAQDTFKNLVQGKPKNIQAALAYGEVLLDMNEPREALPYLAQVVDSHPVNPEPYIIYAQAHISSGLNPKAAIQVLRHVLQDEPAHGQALTLLGEAFTAKGDPKAAIDAYDRALETPLSANPAWRLRMSLGLGKAAIQEGEIETALAILQECYNANPHNLEIVHSLAQAFQKANMVEKAHEILQTAYELAPNDVTHLTWVADFALDLEALHIAIPALKKLTQLAPHQVSAYLKLGQAQLLNGDTSQAQVTFSQLCDLENPSPEALTQAGEELINLGQIPKAIDCLERSAQICAVNSFGGDILPQTWSLLATCYQTEGDPDKALAYLDEAITAQLENPVWRLQKADLLSSLERYQAALVSLEHALDLAPDDPNLHYKTALLYRSVGDNETALNHATISEREYRSLEGDTSLRRFHSLTLSANLAWSLHQAKYARQIFSEGMPEILANLTDTQYDLLDGVCLYVELLLADDEEIEAAQVLTSLLSITSQYPRIKALQARLTARQGNPSESRLIFADALAAHNNQTSENISTASCLALGQAAQELQNWNQAIELYQQGLEIAPTETLAQLYLGRAIVLRAEIHRLSEDVQVLRHVPGSESVSATTRQILLDTLSLDKEKTSSDTQFRKWQARGAAIFTPRRETAAALEEIPPQAENLAAQIGALRYSHAKREATYLARNSYPEIEKSPILAAQVSLALLSSEPQMAYQAAQTALKNNNDNLLPFPLLHALMAIAALSKDNAQVAHQAINTALSYWEDEPRWQALASQVAETPQEAILHLENAINLEPEYPGHYLRLGKAHLEVGQADVAIPILEQVIALAPEQTEAWIILSESYHSTNELEKAMDCAHQALKLSPESLVARKQLAILTMEKKAYSEAEIHLHALLEREPQNSEILELLVQSLAEQNRPQQALTVLAKAIPLRETPLPLQLKRASLLHQAEGLSTAIDALSDLTKEYPQNYEVLFPLASSWAEAGEHQRALEIAQQALKSNHGGPTQAQKADLQIFMGRLLRQMGQLDQAVHHLHQATQLAPHSGEAYIELGRAEQSRRQYNKALDALNQSIENDPQEPQAYYYAGLTLKELNDYAQAERMLRQAAKLAPNDLRIRRQLGVLATLNLVHG